MTPGLSVWTRLRLARLFQVVGVAFGLVTAVGAVFALGGLFPPLAVGFFAAATAVAFVFVFSIAPAVATMGGDT